MAQRSAPALLALFILLLLGGCAGRVEPEPAAASPAPPATPVEPAVAPAPVPAAPVPAPPVPVRPFPVDTLYDLLVAELALRRGDVDTAVQQYAEQARLTRDAGVVAQAARLAAYAGGESRALDLALLWAEVAPDDADARQAAATQLIRAGRLQEALEQLAVLRALSGDASFGYLAIHAAQSDPAARDALLETIGMLARRYPDDPQLVFAQALLLEQAGAIEAALAQLDTLTPAAFSDEAALLRARLLEASGQRGAAIAWLQQRVELPGSDRRLRYTLARLLIDADDLDAARLQFETLLLETGDTPEVLLSLGLIAMEQQDDAGARTYLERLLATGRRQDAARYYLGMLAEDAGSVDEALAYYGRVEPGYEFGNAQARAARLALQTGGAAALRTYLGALRGRHPGERVELWLLEAEMLREQGEQAAALDVLDTALRALPDDIDLLYARSLLRDEAGDLAGVEADLRRLLELDADNASALNALGYILGNRTDRLAEARSLVERALALRPDDPAFIDSLGWIEYREGDLERAEALLRQAFEQMPNHEVAAHLGEVLWQSGQQAAAAAVWRRGLELEPGSRIIAEAVRRLTGREPDALPDTDA